MTDKPKIGWLLLDEADLEVGAMVLGFYTEKHKAIAAADGYAEKYRRSRDPFIIPVFIDCPIDD